MKKYNAETELEQRLETLDNEIKQMETDDNRRMALLKLKKKLENGEETFANPIYAKQFQRECLNKAWPLFNHALKEGLPICFSTVNICQGQGKDKATRWLSYDKVESFNARQAVNTLRKQLGSLPECCGFITVEIKWDERFDRFLPHAHILSFGATAASLKKMFQILYPIQETKRICRSFYDEKSKRGHIDALALQYPTPIKPAVVKEVVLKNCDFRRVLTYTTKLKSYCSKYWIRHLKPIRYKNKTYRPAPKVHNTHLLFLDCLQSSAVFAPFNTQLMQPITPSQAEGFDGTPLTEKNALSLLGYSSFRPKQKAVVTRILKYDRSFFRLRTGFGKSLCFQTAALCQSGVCVVIEPLISVMDDQVKRLNMVVPHSAVAINGKTADKKAIYEQIRRGKYKFLYITPETFCHDALSTVFRRIEICQIVVNEAHCIAFYGENHFRPQYLKIGETVRMMKTSAKVVALTGSADAKTIKAIRKSLKIPEKACAIGNISRSEITYSVKKRKGTGRKQLCRMIEQCNGTVLIFCTLRDTAKAVSAMLRKKGIATELFLGKGKNNADIIAKSKNERLVIVATSALCMGVDIPRVELVIHFEPPLSLAEYCQGSGRGAREQGSCAKAVMMYTENDLTYIRKCFCKTKSDNRSFDSVCRYIEKTGNHRRMLSDALN